MGFRFVALMTLGLNFGAAQTKVKSKPAPQATPVPPSLKAAAMDVYVVLDDGVTNFNPLNLKLKTDRLKAELLLAEDAVPANGLSEGDMKAQFGDYELAKMILPILVAERQAYDLLLLQSDSCQKFESFPKMFDDCRQQMNKILDGISKTYSQAKSALDRTRHPSGK
jgi:hypothetical protein